MDFNEIFSFTPKQLEASRLVDRYDYVLYGGSMGSGKSYFLRANLVRMLLKYHAQGIDRVIVGLFCENYPALKDRHLLKIRSEFPEWLGDYSGADYTFTLRPRWGGGIIAFRNLDDASKYHSAQFAAIAIDELTRNGEDVFTDLRTRLRWPGIDHPKFIGATTPGGIGHLWVKKLWIDGTFPEYETEADQFAYLKALPQDNPYIWTPAYEKKLMAMPLRKRKAYYEGDWNMFEGQYFEEWDPAIHVVKPFLIPEHWLRYRSIDTSGQNGITSCHWYALDEIRNVYAYREHYGSGRNAHEHASQIKVMSLDETYEHTMIDDSAFAKAGFEKTMADIYIEHGVDGLLPSGKQQRVAGWDIVREYLKPEDPTKPKLRIFNRCTNMIRTLPALVHDPENPDDVDTTCEDHAADELRYLLQSLRGERARNQHGEPQSKLETIIRRRLHDLYGHKDDFDYQYRR